MTIVVGAALFFFIPRWDVESREVPDNEPLRTVGFSKTITLGELGDVVQNPDVVMRVQFFRGRSSRPFKLADEPLLRGSVVTRYEQRRLDAAHAQAPPVSLPTEADAP